MGAITFETATDYSFTVSVSPCTRQLQGWTEEVYIAARTVAGRAKKPLLLFFSGGLDSEIMCRAFFDQGITFTAATFEHSENANRPDVEHARKWCWDRKVTHEIIPFDTKYFLETGVDAYTGRFVSGNVIRYFELAVLEWAEARSMYAVIGDGSPHFHSDRKSPGIYLQFGIGERNLAGWCAQSKMGHEPFFFRSIPELWAAYLELPLVKLALSNPPWFYNGVSHHTFKRFVHQSHFPGVSSRTYYPPFGMYRTRRLQKELELKKMFGDRLKQSEVTIDALAEGLRHV